MRKWITGILALIGIDQLSKWIALVYLPLHLPQPLIPFLNLTLTYNEGASFGLLSDAGGWQRWFFVAIAVAVVLYLYHWLKQIATTDCLSAIGLISIISGAIGNGIDRIFRGYVIDFVDVYYQQYHWPVFNFADMVIVLGALILIITAVREPDKSDKR